MHGSVYSSAQLSASGLTRRMIDRLVDSGRLKRICRGWYAAPTADSDVVRAIASGGRVGCLSGCAKHGLWVPPHGGGTHVVHGAGSSLRPRPGLTFHPYDRSQAATSVWPVADCLEQVMRRHDGEAFMVVAESAINLGLVHLADVRSLEQRAPTRTARLFKHLSWAQSGSETRVRLFLQLRGVPVSPQAKLEGVGRVDLLVGKSLIIECDSDEHHASRDQLLEDARRDMTAKARGYDRIRIRYSQIWHDWDRTRAFLLAVIRQRRHNRPPRALRAEI